MRLVIWLAGDLAIYFLYGRTHAAAARAGSTPAWVRLAASLE